MYLWRVYILNTLYYWQPLCSYSYSKSLRMFKCDKLGIEVETSNYSKASFEFSQCSLSTINLLYHSVRYPGYGALWQPNWIDASLLTQTQSIFFHCSFQSLICNEFTVFLQLCLGLNIRKWCLNKVKEFFLFLNLGWLVLIIYIGLVTVFFHCQVNTFRMWLGFNCIMFILGFCVSLVLSYSLA